MKTYTGRKLQRGIQWERIIINGLIIAIDRTYTGKEWTIRKGFKPEYMVKTENELFTVWTLEKQYENGKSKLAVAIPA